MRKSLKIVLLLILFCVPSARADDLWRFSITPYLWLPAVDTKLQVAGVPVQVDNETNSSDLLSDLDFGLLGCFEVRRGKIGLFCDFQYLKFGIDGSTGFQGRTPYDATLTLASSTVAGEFRVIDEQKFSLDALAGARVFYAKTSLDVGPTPLLGASFEDDQSKTIVDPIVGLKAKIDITNVWSVHLYGDIGGFGAGSDLTYQLLGTIAFHVNEHLALHVGYRYFAVDIDKGGFEFDTTLSGPLVGMTISF